MKRDIKLLHAIEEGNVASVKNILRTSSPNVQDHDKSALMLAIEHNNLDIIDILINNKLLKINAQNKEGLTALHLAVKKNNPIMVGMLLMYGANCYIKDNNKKRAYDYLSTIQVLSHQTSKVQNKNFIFDFFYHSGFRDKGVDEPLPEPIESKKKVRQDYNENFIKKAHKMYELYENTPKEYLQQR